MISGILTSIEIELINKEFLDFKTPNNFSGGCKKSSIIEKYCVHLRPDGSIGKVEENCPNKKNCLGFNYKYSLPINQTA